MTDNTAVFATIVGGAFVIFTSAAIMSNITRLENEERYKQHTERMKACVAAGGDWIVTTVPRDPGNFECKQRRE